MAARPLARSFYDRETEIVARELLGMILVHRVRGRVLSGRIVETEAYLGEHDPACHAVAGRTPRTEPLYGRPGTAYVYFTYGMHWCANAVTRAEGLPSAVLIRALEPIDGIAIMRRHRLRARGDAHLCDGPAKLCQALGIGGAQNKADLTRGPLCVVPGQAVPDRDVRRTPRIGITRARSWPLRWIVVP